MRALVVVDVAPNMPPDRGREVMAFMNAKVELNTLDDYVEQALSFNPRRDRELLRTSLLFNLRDRPDGGLAWKWDRGRWPAPEQRQGVEPAAAGALGAGRGDRDADAARPRRREHDAAAGGRG